MEKIDANESVSRLFNALIERALWDYAHRRSTFLSEGGGALKTTSSFLFLRGDGGLADLITHCKLPLDINKLRDQAIKTRESVEARTREKRLKYYKSKSWKSQREKDRRFRLWITDMQAQIEWLSPPTENKAVI